MSKLHQLALTKIDGVGYILARLLIKHFEDASLIFKATKKQLLQVPGIGKLTAERIISTQALDLAAKELEYLEKKDVQLLYYSDEAYPYRLKNCIDAPIILYYKGTVDLNHPRILSVVGTRNATAYGKQLCLQVAHDLKNQDVVIISGLAYGIDIAMHVACLQHNIPTIGVLGHGVDRIYPNSHRSIAQEMLKNGGVLSEFPLNTNPERENFPKRNRVIAGMSDAVVIIEAAKKGGALITADLADSYNKDVFAFPGRVGDTYSEGCNHLIKTNKAALINAPKDILYYLGWDKLEINIQKKSIQRHIPIDLSVIELQIYKILEEGKQSIDFISKSTKLTQSQLSVALLGLELRGIIESWPGSLYSLS